MLVFNEFRIDRDNEKVHLNIELDDPSEAFYIDNILLTVCDNVDTNGSIIDRDKCVIIEHPFVRHYSAVFDVESLSKLGITSVKNQAMFVRIVYTDDYEMIDESAVTIDWQTVYETGMPHVANIAAYGFNNTDMPKGFEEYIIIWNALQLAITVGDIEQIRQTWARFLRVSDALKQSCFHC